MAVGCYNLARGVGRLDQSLQLRCSPSDKIDAAPVASGQVDAVERSAMLASTFTECVNAPTAF